MIKEVVILARGVACPNGLLSVADLLDSLCERRFELPWHWPLLSRL
jgi:hypothetical protein